MNYEFLPDNHSKEEINNKFENYDMFTQVLRLYKVGFEEYISNIIHSEKIDDIITSVINLPILEDSEYNIYHKYSNLKSKYFYIRNNYYVEKLTNEEINTLLSGNANEEFFKSTMERVIFEDYENTFFGKPIMKNLVNGKSIIFEFCYNALNLKTLDELDKANNLAAQLFEYVKKQLNLHSDYNLSFLITDLPNNDLKKDKTKNI